jgi:outer membrane murein-binding lipoprotein Lpp
MDWVTPGHVMIFLVVAAAVGGAAIAYEQQNHLDLSKVHAKMDQHDKDIDRLDKEIDQLTRDFRDYRLANERFQAEQRSGVADLSKILSGIQIELSKRQRR